MDTSEYAFAQGVQSTREALAAWNREPWPVLRSWLLGSLGAAAVLLVAVLVVAALTNAGLPAGETESLHKPPFYVGGAQDVIHVLLDNSLVLALHALACVAGFVAGSSLPLQARERRGAARFIHERGGSIAIAFVLCATLFSLLNQAYVLGTGLASSAVAVHASRALLLVGLLPHAIPELTALFLPLAAWIIASRRGDWDKLLAATFVTVAVAVPVLVVTALWEVYVAPHLLQGLIGY
ncbi:MAG TPA: stage II sporulation protein M [Solirubrobacteraceae bacterium]|jgi:hypothetical protein|nr:stage II sporulation protein M [Solirubrobacteraceae bacterium]